MNRKAIVMMFTGMTLAIVLGSGLFNEAQEAQLSKTAWVATTAQ